MTMFLVRFLLCSSLIVAVQPSPKLCKYCTFCNFKIFRRIFGDLCTSFFDERIKNLKKWQKRQKWRRMMEFWLIHVFKNYHSTSLQDSLTQKTKKWTISLFCELTSWNKGRTMIKTAATMAQPRLMIVQVLNPENPIISKLKVTSFIIF